MYYLEQEVGLMDISSFGEYCCVSAIEAVGITAGGEIVELVGCRRI